MPYSGVVSFTFKNGFASFGGGGGTNLLFPYAMWVVQNFSGVFHVRLVRRFSTFLAQLKMPVAVADHRSISAHKTMRTSFQRPRRLPTPSLRSNHSFWVRSLATLGQSSLVESQNTP